MEGGPEIEAGHHHPHTGHWIDYVLGCAAIVISLVSLYLGTKNAEHMERLVAANSYPDLSFATGNSADGDVISFDLTNHGVGPARIKTLELFYGDKPLAAIHDLLVAALGEEAQQVSPDRVRVMTSPALGELLPPRETISLARIPRAGIDEAWEALDKTRFKVHASICYCSLFNECFRRDSNKIEPEPVKACKATQPVIFHETEPESYWTVGAGR